MKCALCSKEIDKYSVGFNNLKIDEIKSVDICENCINRFINWHGKNLAKLFPSKLLKKKFEMK